MEKRKKEKQSGKDSKTIGKTNNGEGTVEEVEKLAAVPQLNNFF